MTRAGPWLGVLIGLALAIVVIGRGAARRDAPLVSPARAETLRPVPDDKGALREVVMHYVSSQEGAFGPTYRDFLRSLPPDTRVVIVARKGDEARRDDFLASVAPKASIERVSIDAELGIWSKDRALVLSPAGSDGVAELLVPPRPRAAFESSRPRDWDVAPALASALPDRFRVREVPIAFDAGDFTIAGDRVIFDVNLFARNRARGVRDPEELAARVKASFGREAIMLGSHVGDVPRHHMSMYMAALDDHTALVGDPAAAARIVGSKYVPGEVSPETKRALGADFSHDTQARFDSAAASLGAAGFTVIRVPTVPFDDKTYFAYTNAVFETRGGERIVRMPTFDVPALDGAARAVYETLGFRVIAVSARALYPEHGTLGCVVNVTLRG